MATWALVAVVVLGVNLLPVLGPPTWVVLVLFRLHEHVGLLSLVVIGAVSATTGRVLLAHGTRWAARWLPADRVARLEAAGQLLRRNRVHSALGLAVFLVSPLPSAQLFEAAGVMRLHLRSLAAAFFVGRLVSYSLYTGAASIAERSFGDAVAKSLTSRPSVLLQLALVLGVWELSRIDWVSRLSRQRPAPSPSPEPPGN